MAAGREILTKIKSVGKTKQITKAMQLVSASKKRRAEDRMAKTRPYAKKALQVICHLANCHSEYQHPYLQQCEEVKRVGFILVSTDRGLCGGLNNVLFKRALLEMQQLQQQGVEIELCLIGKKAAAFFKRFGGNIVAHVAELGDAPELNDLIGAVGTMLTRYDEGQLDMLKLAYNEFVNTMKQDPTILQLLPLEGIKDESSEYHWDYIYEPDAKELLDLLLKRYVESQVYQAVVENNACEQAARMVAMQSATDNADKLTDELTLVYNKARQAVITQEISEIVSGADAV